ncbi:hypothetical protein DET0252 [Dehalococcoides mccartyi 195]|uniref:Transcriptional regulator n=1 Tax=Dehalococcoides mccartyi (strain ATCC BAA-2266 / KCTC 15142 / 195) TaxID=243164 RepID=Q3Z9S8_DEHM1|nr:hypothetical protein DET0885 [Dehalococcoides mccartyi 195]AAW40427.1 hypothetical protein DET0273 [Dehalococcoides mccartyi 195]AAW40472.1 hypothetical protein DET0252 [Dehalococcoides mccartyi 195]
MSNKIVDIIKQYLGKNSISGNQFSRTIGFDPAIWCRIKHKKMQPSPAFLTSVARTYPELRLQIQESMFGTEENDGN